jgi:hypothetical protein
MSPGTTAARQFPRTLASLALLLMIGGVACRRSSRGADIRDGHHDLGHNGVWLQHGWLGDNRWFEVNDKVDRIPTFRSPESIRQLGARLRSHHITDLFPHLCPSDRTGRIAAVDDTQVERFLDEIGPVRVLPWVGGTLGGSAHPDDVAWRSGFASSIAELLRRHPRLAGVQINIEPMPTGRTDYLQTLSEVRRAMPAGKILSIAAYPPPTPLHPFPEVHWDEDYFRSVAARADQMAVMMYDTALREQKPYQNLMNVWTEQVLAWSGSAKVLLGIPAYEDAGVNYHDPSVENIANALVGVHAALERTPALPPNYQGVAIYCDWEMNGHKWADFDARFLRASAATSPASR